MFSNTYQSGLVSLFYSCGSNPLSIWDKQVKNGHIRRVVDDDVKSLVLEISGTNVSTTYITCPSKQQTSLGIRLPFLVMIIKNLKKYFTFEIQILDDKSMHRRFRVSNFQSTTRVHPFCTTMPIGLSNGWNQVQFNLADFTKRAYGSSYIETTRVQINANIRIRRIYFCDRLYSEEEMPNEFKLFLPGNKPEAKPSRQYTKQTKDQQNKAPLKTEKRPSVTVEREIPSGAPPTPAEIESPTRIEPPPTEQESTTPVEAIEEALTPVEEAKENVNVDGDIELGLEPVPEEPPHNPADADEVDKIQISEGPAAATAEMINEAPPPPEVVN